VAKKTKAVRQRRAKSGQTPRIRATSLSLADTGLPNRSVSSDFRSHPTIWKQFFLVVPRPLLERLERNLDPVPWNQDERQLEFDAADRCGSAGNLVGFRDGLPLHNDDVRPPTPLPVVTEAVAQELGWELNQAQLDIQRRVLQIRLHYFSSVARGYAGWLISNPVFQREQSELIDAWQTEIGLAGLSGVGKLINAAEPPAELLTAQELRSSTDREKEFGIAVRQFLVRWRLNELTAPSLPAPAKPLMAGTFPLSISNQLMDMGGVFHIPDTYPIPSRDELRAMLDETLHSGAEAAHLQEWHRIVGVGNSAKNQIERFARVRQVCHYWAILHDRYGDQLRGQTEALHEAFATFFAVSADTIRGDLRIISRRLSPEWAISRQFRLSLTR
jgi:hypothetical protein